MMDIRQQESTTSSLTPTIHGEECLKQLDSEKLSHDIMHVEKQVRAMRKMKPVVEHTTDHEG
jgi:hypothetical protein